MQVGEVWIKISGKDGAFNSTMAKVQRTMKASVKEAEASSQAILRGVTVAAAAAGAAIVGIGTKAVQTAANMNALNEQFKQVFGELSSAATENLNKIADDTGILPNRLKGSFAQMSAFAKTTGMDTADALALTSRATRAAADSAAFYDKSIEEVTERIQAYLKGNYENDAALGISSTETTRNAAANKLYGKSFMELSEAQKQLTLLAMIEEGNELSGALGQAARESDAFENQLGNLKQSVTDFMVVIGQPLLEPVIDAFKRLSEHLTTFKDLVTDEGLAGAIEKIIPDWLEGAIFAVAGAITVAIIPALIGMATAAWAAIVPLAPFLAAGAAIGALAYVIIKNWEPIGEFFINLWEGIKAKTTEIWESIKKFLVGWWPYLLGALMGPIGLLVAAIYNNWDAIKQSTIEIWTTIQTWLYELWEKIKSQMTKAWDSIYKALTNVWDMIKTGFNNLVDSAKNWGRNLIQNFIDGIEEKWEDLKGILTEAANTVSDFLGFSSPTKKGPGRYADRWAPNLVNMFAEGIKNSMPALQISLADMAAVMPAALGPSIINNSTSNNDSGNIFHIHVTGGSTREQAEGIMRELHRLGVRF